MGLRCRGDRADGRSLREGGLASERAVGSRFLIASSDSTRDYLKMVTAGWGTKYEIMGHHLNVSDSLRRRIITEVPSRFFETVEMMSFRCHDFPATSPLSV